jgi:hypothetical protein
MRSVRDEVWWRDEARTLLPEEEEAGDFAEENFFMFHRSGAFLPRHLRAVEAVVRRSLPLPSLPASSRAALTRRTVLTAPGGPAGGVPRRYVLGEPHGAPPVAAARGPRRARLQRQPAAAALSRPPPSAAGPSSQPHRRPAPAL